MFKEEILEQFVIDLKVVESSNNFDDIFKNYKGNYLFLFELENKEEEPQFEKLQSYVIKKITADILTYVKGVF